MYCAFEHLVPNKPGLSGVTTVIPIGLAIDIVKSGAGGGHTGVGQASMEVEFLDSMTNERIAAAMDTKPGDKLETGFCKRRVCRICKAQGMQL